MFRLLYLFGSFTLLILLIFLWPFSKKIKAFLKERQGRQKLPPAPKKYWIHCASLGEFEMAVPILEEIEKDTPLEQVIITFFSPSGYNQAMKTKWASSVCYAPLDIDQACKNFYDDYQPEKAIFIRSELWYNLVSIGQKRGIPFYLVNARFQHRHFVYSFLGKPYLRLLQQFEKIYCSDKKTYEVAGKKGLQNLVYTGDTRYDRLLQFKQNSKLHASLVHYKQNDLVMVLGSSWQKEEAFALRLLENSVDIKLIIAPHDVSRERVAGIANQYSAYKPKLLSEGQINSEDPVVIIDSIGQLASTYALADFAFVGGGFSGALHNIIEPAAWGCHISFGPKISKFPEAQDFIEAGFANAVESGEEWISRIQELAKDKATLQRIKVESETWVSEGSGAINKIKELI